MPRNIARDSANSENDWDLHYLPKSFKFNKLRIKVKTSDAKIFSSMQRTLNEIKNVPYKKKMVCEKVRKGII